MTAFFGFAHAPLRVETITNGETTRILIHGEVDIANVNHLYAALSAIELDGTTSVQIDASELAFFDVAALRCFVAFAQRVRQSGRDLTTCGAAPMLHKVARMLGLQDELGLH